MNLDTSPRPSLQYANLNYLVPPSHAAEAARQAALRQEEERRQLEEYQHANRPAAQTFLQGRLTKAPRRNKRKDRDQAANPGTQSKGV